MGNGADPADRRRRDVFLSHASPDKEQYVRPFAEELARRGISFWLDEAEIDWGDSITRKINEGLSLSRYVVVFLSPDFMGRQWPEAELAAALNRENSDGETVVLPVVIGDARSVLARYPLLRDKLYLDGRKGPSFLADRLEKLLRSENVPPIRFTLVGQRRLTGGPTPTGGSATHSMCRPGGRLERNPRLVTEPHSTPAIRISTLGCMAPSTIRGPTPSPPFGSRTLAWIKSG